MHKTNGSVVVMMLAGMAALGLAAGTVLGQAETPPPRPAPSAETAPATEPAAPAVSPKLAEDWDNFLHYILLANAEVAERYGKAILDSNPDVKDLYYLSVRVPSSPATLARGRGLKSLVGLIDQVTRMTDQGARAVRMDPQEIARWIENLSGSPRQFLSASERLTNSGEYAAPQLVAALADPKCSLVTRDRIVAVLPRLGKDAVRPLTEALAAGDPAVKEVVCQALGRIGYRHAACYLKELAESKNALPRTRDAAVNALAACDPGGMRKPVAELFYDAATKYYRHDDSVAPDSRYDTANVWYWQEGLGLTYKVVPRVIFNEIYARRMAQMALRHDANFDPAVTLWLAANLREETVLPAGQTDPTHPAGEPSADFYALASSAKNLQAVLERAISEQDTAVVMRAISALARTAGAENLVAAVEGGAQPLVAALTYPSRQVRFMAAEALVLARPQKPFPGWHLVVPVLIEALRGTGVPVAVLADPDQEHRNKVKDLLRAAGLEVVDGPAFGPALQGARSGAGVDLVVLSSNLSGPDAAGAVGMLRREGAISRVPVILVGRAAQMTAVRDLAKSDPLSQVLAEEQLNAGEVASAVKAAFAKAAGSQPTSAPGGEVQSEDWAIRAADALHGLAERRNPVFDLTDATRSLIAATKDKRDRVRLAAAAALSQFRAGAAQQAIADLAGDDAAGENVRVEAYVSLSESVRLFGNQLTEKQTKAIVDTVMGKGSQAIRDAAAQALGALALPAEKIKELILAAQ